jgi:hypothetical protein
VLEFDLEQMRCVEPHRDARVQRMAECFLESYIEKRKKPEAMPAVAS